MASVVKRPAPLPRWFWFASLLGCTPGFKKSRCKRLLKKTMSRIRLLKGRREVQVRQLRRDVAQLLQLGQEENAENRLDRLWKEHSLLSAYIKIGEYCQFVKANLRNIAGQRECPMDLKESLASLCFSASCCADLPELQELRDIMVMKYGNTFLTSAQELLPGEHVNRLFLDAFSTKHPLEVSKKALLKSIVAEYNVVQPKKSKVHGMGGASQKTASSDCNTSLKQQSRHECGSITENCKQDPKLNALEQEEKHRKQIRHSISTPASEAFTEEHASSPHVEGAYDRTMVGQHKKDTVWRGVNETDHSLQERTTIYHDRHGKENFKSRLKAFKKNKKNTRVSQAGQTGQLTPSNSMSFYEKSGLDGNGNEVMRGLQQVHGNTDNQKTSKLKEVQGCVIGQQLSKEKVDLYGHAKHRENKHSNQEYCAETNQQVLLAHSLKHGYHDEALSEDCIAHQMLQQGNFDHKKHDLVEREAHTRSNGKVRPDGVRPAFDNVEHERELCHMDPKSKHYGRSNKKLTNELDNEHPEKSPHRRNHHAERGTKVDVHRIDLSLRPEEADYGIDYRQSPLTGNGVLPEQRKPPNVDCSFGETKCKHKSRSNGKSRPGRATNEQVRSPCKRNEHVEGEIRFPKPRPGMESSEIENWQALQKCHGSLPECGDGTPKVQKVKEHSLNKNHKNACTMASSVDNPNAQMLQKGRKHQGRKHHLEGPQQEAWADYNEAVVPERAMNLSPGSHIRADGMRYDSKYHAKQREKNFHLMENRSSVASFQQEAWADYNEAVVPERGMNLSPGSYIRADDVRFDSKVFARQREKDFHLMEDRPTVSNIETAWDLEAARQNESALEPCMDGELLPGDHGHVRQRHKRLAKKHISAYANSMRPEQEGIAEGTENVQNYRPRYTNGPHVPEDDSNNVAQRKREHFPHWHNQFDPLPKGYEGSVAPDTRAPPQVASAHGGWKEQKNLENLQKDLVAKSSSAKRVEGNSSPSRFSNPPQRPPPPVPPYRVSSMPNRKPLNSPPAMRQRCATLETSHVRTGHEPHVHPKLPEYEDLVANFAALKNKPARPPMD